MPRLLALVAGATLFAAAVAHADVPDSSAHALTIVRTATPPTIDGRIDDPAWKAIAPVTAFWKMRPVDNQPADERTEAYLAYDDARLYVAIRAFESHAAGVRASLSARDNIGSDDFVGILLDTFHDQRRGYEIFVNPLGVQMDGVSAEGQDDDYSIDLVFESAGRRTPEGYEVEMAIPFRSLRFSNARAQTWGIALLRQVQHSAEQDVYPHVDRGKTCTLCQLADAEGMERISPGRTFELLPSVTGLRRGAIGDATPFTYDPAKYEAGLGVKLGVTPNLTGDLTLNPDFSQIESDAPQVTVNQRFALFYPEKRPFFLEGQDLFASQLQLVYTRTIYDPMVAGKLTGKVGATTVGILSALDEHPLLPRGDVAPVAGVPGDNAVFNVVRLKQDFGTRTTLGVYATDREHADSHNRVGALDGSVRVGDHWFGNAQGAWSDTRNLEGGAFGDYALTSKVGRDGDHLSANVLYEDVGPDFRADAGFIKRTDYRRGSGWIGWLERPNGAVVQRWQPQLFYLQIYDHAGFIENAQLAPELSINFAHNLSFYAELDHNLERFAAVDYRGDQLYVEVSAEPWKVWTGGFHVLAGDQIHYDESDPFLGQGREIAANTTVRPSDNLRLDCNVIQSQLWRYPGGPRTFDVDIVRAKTTYQFDTRLALRAIAEWQRVAAPASLDRTVSFDVLLSYIAGPGTVFYLGYDDGYRHPASNPLVRESQAVFFKASYLWRM